MKKSILLYSIAILCLCTACKKDSDSSPVSQSTNLKSTNDGFISNSTPKVISDYYLGGQGKELRIGWDGQGKAMRVFLSFDFSNIQAPSGEKLVLEEAVLKVYESNTNLHPFDGDGTRNAECYLVDYQTLDVGDFDIQSVSNCGIIADWGYNVLKEHSLNVTTKLVSFLNSNPSADKFQFRIQFQADDNVAFSSPLNSSMWNIFAGEESSKSDYCPVLSVTYHHEKE